MIEPLDPEVDARDPVAAPPDAPPEDRPAARWRIRRDVAIGAAALIAVALIGKVLSNSSGPPPSSPSSSPAQSPAQPTVGQSAQRDEPAALPPPRRGHVAACPATVHCLTQSAGNGRVLEPVRAQVPKARLLRFHTVLLQTPPWAGRLWYRELDYRLPDGQRLEIVISALPEPASEQPVPVNAAAVFAGPYLVTATATAHALPIEQLARIASDDRLLTT